MRQKNKNPQKIAKLILSQPKGHERPEAFVVSPGRNDVSDLPVYTMKHNRWWH